MANRSYIYSIDFDRSSRKKQETDKMYGLSEYPYEIPLSYKILVSQETKMTDSIIWDYEYPIAIQGNFELGRKKLFDFLNELLKKNIFDKTELENQIKEAKEFLFEEKRNLKFVFLENGEIYEMGDEKIEAQNQNLFEEISDINQIIEEFLLDIQEQKQKITDLDDKIIELNKTGFWNKIFHTNNNSIKITELEKKKQEIEQEMWNLLGINYWDDVLYFQFDE